MRQDRVRSCIGGKTGYHFDFSNKTVDINPLKNYRCAKIITNLKDESEAWICPFFNGTKQRYLGLPFDTCFKITIDCIYPDVISNNLLEFDIWTSLHTSQVGLKSDQS